MRSTRLYSPHRTSQSLDTMSGKPSKLMFWRQKSQRRTSDGNYQDLQRPGNMPGVVLAPHGYTQPNYPHAEFMLPIRVVPGMTGPPQNPEQTYPSPAESLNEYTGNAYDYSIPPGHNLASIPNPRSNHRIRTDSHRRSVSMSSPSPAAYVPPSSTSSVPPWSWGPPDRRFPALPTLFDGDLESLKHYDLVFIVCDSPTMNQNGKWQQCGDLLSQLAQVAMEYDSDGVEIHFLNTESERSARTFTTEEDVRAMFADVVSPAGSSRLSDILDPLLSEYQSQLKRYIDSNPARPWLTPPKPKKAIYVVLTDGQHTDQQNITNIIVNMARYLDEIHAPISQLGIELVEIGGGRSEFFRWLDQDMYTQLDQHSTLRDIVRTDTYQGGELERRRLGEILLGSVNGNA